MFGDIIDRIIQVLRNSQVVIANKISVCVISSDETQTVNTPLPAIAVGVEDSNYSWSADKQFQASLISLGHGVRNAVEKAKTAGDFLGLQQKYNLWPLYQGFKTYQRISTKDTFNTEVMVCEVMYESTVFDLELARESRPTEEVEKVKIKGFTGTDQDLTTELPIVTT